jgi:hypothetical protein
MGFLLAMGVFGEGVLIGSRRLRAETWRPSSCDFGASQVDCDFKAGLVEARESEMEGTRNVHLRSSHNLLTVFQFDTDGQSSRQKAAGLLTWTSRGRANVSGPSSDPS